MRARALDESADSFSTLRGLLTVNSPQRARLQAARSAPAAVLLCIRRYTPNARRDTLADARRLRRPALTPRFTPAAHARCASPRSSRSAAMWRAAAAQAASAAARRLRRGAPPAHQRLLSRAPPPPGPGLAAFLPAAAPLGPAQWLEAATGAPLEPSAAASAATAATSPRRSVFIETYGCQMNSNDTEVLLSILRDAGYGQAAAIEDADVLLLNTCAIRDGAETKIWARLRALQHLRKRGRRRPGGAPVIGVLGCMAERLKEKLLETDGLADIVAGPDAYRDLPRLISVVAGSPGERAMNVQLSADETYADVAPLRQPGAVSAFLSVMRGCSNMCTFCIVPFTRGRERSRPISSILHEVRALAEAGVKEITLLGQNVNSFADFSEPGRAADGVVDASASSSSAADRFAAVYAPGFRSVYVPKRAGAVRFAELLDRVADVAPEVRVRFTSPHPKDFPDEVLAVLRDRHNVALQVHLPAQSGSTTVLERMRRGYDRDAYLALAHRIRAVLPGVALSSDFISGFCGESEAEHADTLSLISAVRYEAAFMFAYSQRDKTAAARHLADDVAPEVKQRRLAEVIDAFRTGATQRAAAEVGTTHCVLVEGPSRRSAEALTGRTDSNKRVVFADVAVGADLGAAAVPVRLKPGDYVAVRITGGTMASLAAVPLARTTLAEFYGADGAAVAEMLRRSRLQQQQGAQRAASGV